MHTMYSISLWLHLRNKLLVFSHTVIALGYYYRCVYYSILINWHFIILLSIYSKNKQWIHNTICHRKLKLTFNRLRLPRIVYILQWQINKTPCTSCVLQENVRRCTSLSSSTSEAIEYLWVYTPAKENILCESNFE